MPPFPCSLPLPGPRPLPPGESPGRITGLPLLRRCCSEGDHEPADDGRAYFGEVGGHDTRFDGMNLAIRSPFGSTRNTPALFPRCYGSPAPDWDDESGIVLGEHDIDPGEHAGLEYSIGIIHFDFIFATREDSWSMGAIRVTFPANFFRIGVHGNAVSWPAAMRP